ncbi:hypothetical protein FHS18_006640 [Paenibacillus phyllosphaerae]|uniref:Uncharacterized protein n=1 Tax=Paenibacillus phyllosphaerae TaxID=274593 RepID=A0A7W5B5F3_9BACL|nr:hypothetical protein [Paenibacillus phyllosphaerae]MBB3114519.1 hypothetical protein [Paenibacillus phyllosphaerae]
MRIRQENTGITALKLRSESWRARMTAGTDDGGHWSYDRLRTDNKGST